MRGLNVILKHKWLAVCIILLVGFAAIHMVQAVEDKQAVEPGTKEDPLVSQSYVDEKLLELKTYGDLYNEELLKQLEEKTEKLEELDEQLKAFKEQLESSGQQGGKFVVVENLAAGQKLIADESTEIILRAGKVKAIASENGGLSDVTAGKDIQEGEFVETNHLIIIPRTDGRGVVSEVDSVLMVKGMFRIE